MSYEAIDQLTADPTFNGRERACTVEQAGTFKDSARADFVAVAEDCLTGGILYLTFVRMAAAGPGIADKVTTPDGIDQSQVTDADLLSLTQAAWPTVAALYFTEDGSPKP